MISSLVFCDTKTDPDPERELAAAKKGLTDGILSVSRVQVRTSAGPKEAYANEHGASLLELVDEMRTQIKTLEQQVMEQREKMTVLEGEGMTQKEKITVLWHLKDSAVAIRKRFFAVYSYKLKPGQISKDPVIKEGNQVAHDGDVITDICLMENGLMDDKETFTALYGLKWERAKELSVHPHIIEVMNIRATELTNRNSSWTSALDSIFDQLIEWTGRATQEEFQAFAKDFTGETYGGGLYKLLKRK